MTINTSVVKNLIFNILDNSLAKLSAAKALARKPDSVIAIWIEERKVLESFKRFSIFFAFLLLF